MSAPTNSVYDEAPAAWALWQFVATRIPEAEIPEFSKLMAGYRDETSHGNAEKIRALGGCDPAGGFAGYDEGMEIAADWIDPSKQESS